MFLKLNNSELNNIKKVASYRKYFKFFNVILSLSSDDAQVLEIFEIIYQNFIIHTQQYHSLECYIIKGSAPEIKPIAIINDMAYPLFEDELFISHAHMIVFQNIIDSIDDYLLIHAGVVAKEGNGFILSGPSGYGKTTLILELISRGYKFYSDEFCPVRLSDFTISAFPRCLGIRENSPFMKHIDPGRSLMLKNIGRGKKYLVNCSDLFPASIGSTCSAKYLIFLRGNANIGITDKRNIVDLALYQHNQEMIDQICQNKGIELINTYVETDYIVYRFSFPLGAGLTNNFKEICDLHKDNIFYQEQVTCENPEFSTETYLKNISKPQASIDLLKSLRNRSSKSRLLDKFNHKNTQLLLTIGTFIKDVECYELKVGPLKEMANIIDTM